MEFLTLKPQIYLLWSMKLDETVHRFFFSNHMNQGFKTETVLSVKLSQFKNLKFMKFDGTVNRLFFKYHESHQNKHRVLILRQL